MQDLMPGFALISLAIAGFSFLGFLYILATRVRDTTMIHDLRVRVFDMRIVYLRKLIETYRQETQVEGDFEIIEDDESTACASSEPERLAA